MVYRNIFTADDMSKREDTINKRVFWKDFAKATNNGDHKSYQKQEKALDLLAGSGGLL